MKPVEIDNETGISLSVQRTNNLVDREDDSIVLMAENAIDDIRDNGCLPILLSKEDARKLAITLIELAKD